MAGGNPITNQATWRLAGPGKDSYIRFPDWSDGVTSANAKKKKKRGLKVTIESETEIPYKLYYNVHFYSTTFTPYFDQLACGTLKKRCTV